MLALKRNVTLSIVLLACIAMGGCGAVVVGGTAAAGTFFYTNGQATASYDATLDDAYAASLAACQELQIPVVSKTMKASSAVIQGTYDQDAVTIRLSFIDESITEVSIRVGFVGDRAESSRIHSAISSKL